MHFCCADVIFWKGFYYENKGFKVLPETLVADDTNRPAESDACHGGSGRCVYAGWSGPELYVCGITGNTDTVYPEYVSSSGDNKSWDSGGTVLGQGG